MLAGSSADKNPGLQRAELVIWGVTRFLPIHPPPTLPDPWHHLPQGGDAGQVLNSLDLILQEETKVEKSS